MAWNDLSIAQRSQLMNIMRHNGIIRLSEMRRIYDLSSPSLSSLGESTFNMRPQAPVYAVGGPKGLDEYIQKRLTEMRERAHKASLERTVPSVPPGQVKMSKEEKWELEQIRKEAADYARQDALQVMQNFVEGLDYVVSPELYDVSDHKEQRMEPGDESAANHWRLAFLRGAKEWDDAAKRTMSEEIWTDPRTCIYTATDNYGRPYRISGNKSFYANPEKYGFKKITVAEVMPGDIVQTKDLSHSMNFNRYDEEGEARYNYSRGGTDERDIVKDGYYTFPLTDKYYNVYRFVGTPADSTRWKQEYAEGMRAFGGERFDGGGDKAPYNGEIRQGKKWNFVDHYLANNPKVAHGLRKAGVLLSDAARLIPGINIKGVEINPRKVSDYGDTINAINKEGDADNIMNRISGGTSFLSAVARTAKPIVNELGKDFPNWKWTPRITNLTNDIISVDKLINMGQFIDDFATPVDQFAKGGHKIHIKKANRGKFTALKKRTGHSASWFKAHGTPAQKKMAIFALNARKWKHAHGGIKF